MYWVVLWNCHQCMLNAYHCSAPLLSDAIRVLFSRVTFFSAFLFLILLLLLFALRKIRLHCHKVRIYFILSLPESLYCCAPWTGAASAGKAWSTSSCGHVCVHVFKMYPPDPRQSHNKALGRVTLTWQICLCEDGKVYLAPFWWLFSASLWCNLGFLLSGR